VALPLENTLEGGTNTTTISAANSGGASGNAFDSIVGTGPTFSSTSAAHGSLAMAPLTTTQSMVQWAASIGTPTEIWIRAYLNIQGNPSANCPFIYVRDQTNAANNCGIRVNSSRVLAITANGSTTVVAFTNVPALSTWVRVELHCLISGGNATCDGRYFASPDAPTATETQTTTQTTTATSFGAVRFGANLTSSGQLLLDDVQVNGTGFPGPYVPHRQPPFHESLAMANRPRLPRPNPRMPLTAWR
jgi:hypothetical protein